MSKPSHNSNINVPTSRKAQAQACPRHNDKDSFEIVATRLNCDTDKAIFEAKLGKIAKNKRPIQKRAGKR